MTTVYWVGSESKDSTAFPNQGMRTTIDCVAVNDGTALIAVWIAETGTNNIWAQVGYYSEGGTMQNFYQIWNLSTNTVVAGGGGSSVSAGEHEFSMYLTSGTVWAFAMDGVVMGSYDLGVSSMGAYGTEPLEALVEEQETSGAITIPNVQFLPCMEVYISGAWIPVSTAYAYENGPYGVEGKDQSSSLTTNEIVVGTAISKVSTNTVLWTTPKGVVSNPITFDGT